MGMDDLTWGSPRYTTLVDNGAASKRLDVAIIGDGYRASEQATFRNDANLVVEEFRRAEPMATYFPHFNFHRIDVISRQSGTDDMWATPRITRRTALDTGYSPIADRRIVGPDPWVMTVATMSGAPWDAIIVIVNYKFYGGATSPLMLVAYVCRGTTMRSGRTSSPFRETAVHEAGHSIAKLFDEYTGDLPDIDLPLDFLPDIVPAANVSASGSNPKWRAWITPGTPLPTPESVSGDPIGAFAGAFSMTRDLFRPKKDCYMNNHGVPFCEVCSEQWIKVIYGKSPLADSFEPSPDTVLPIAVTPRDTVTFHAHLVRPPGTAIRTTWFTKRVNDARWSRRQQTPDYADFSFSFPTTSAAGAALPTAWLVRCVLEDRSPRLRQRPALQAATQEAVWDVVSGTIPIPHADAVIPHGDVNLIPHGDAMLIPHGDIGLIGHGDTFVIPHADVAAGGHGDVALIPHGDVSFSVHGDVPALLHGDVSVAAHVDTPVIPHGDIPALLHGDVGWPPSPIHIDTPSALHIDTPSIGHVDSPGTSHIDTPTVAHVDTPGEVHVDTPASAHIDAPAVAHLDSPPGGHVDTPEVAHIDSPPSGHVDTPATAHVDAPPSHIDAP